MLTLNNKKMNILRKLLLLCFTVFVFVPKGYSQNNADPGIGISMSPVSVAQGSTGILSARVGNYGNKTIVENSLRVTVSVGAGTEIIGIASGSDARWSQLSLTAGSANTIKLTNSAGGFGSFDVGDVLLTVRGNVGGDPDVILENIVYITASNPLLCGGCPSPPLNAFQGNASHSNDNSATSLAVIALIDAVADMAGPIIGDTGGDAGIDVLANDMLNGVAVVPADVTITSTPTPELTVNPDGSVDVTAGTPAGTYMIDYQICEDNNPTNCDIATVTITVIANPLVFLNLKVMLQGALFDHNGALMRDDLRSGGYLPLMEPYTAMGNVRFNHQGAGGAETTTQAVLDINAGTSDAIIDWVFVELRDASAADNVLETRSALVQRDGDVVDPTDGVSLLSFSGFGGQQYYVSVKHRNHMGVMTANPVTLINAGTLVDFTTASNADVFHLLNTYNGSEQVTINGVQALWAGNTTADNKVKYQGPSTDASAILVDALLHPDNTAPIFNFDTAFGYHHGDVNMDGKVKYQGVRNDVTYVFINLLTYTLNTGPLYNFDFMVEQLPE
jgi:hypothetical protein